MKAKDIEVALVAGVALAKLNRREHQPLRNVAKSARGWAAEVNWGGGRWIVLQLTSGQIVTAEESMADERERQGKRDRERHRYAEANARVQALKRYATSAVASGATRVSMTLVDAEALVAALVAALESKGDE